MKPIVIGIAGGTASGKTTMVKKITEKLGPLRAAIVNQDAYYKDLSHLSPEERSKTNFDHPSAIDRTLFIKNLRTLIERKTIKQPVYNFVTHTRENRYQMINPEEVIIVEGNFLFIDRQIRRFVDIKIFLETHDDIRVIRRIKRDMSERGRDLSSILEQYVETVQPMYLEFIEPSKQFADLIIPDNGHKIAIEILTGYLKSKLKTFDADITK